MTCRGEGDRMWTAADRMLAFGGAKGGIESARRRLIWRLWRFVGRGALMGERAASGKGGRSAPLGDDDAALEGLRGLPLRAVEGRTLDSSPETFWLIAFCSLSFLTALTLDRFRGLEGLEWQRFVDGAEAEAVPE